MGVHTRTVGFYEVPAHTWPRVVLLKCDCNLFCTKGIFTNVTALDSLTRLAVKLFCNCPVEWDQSTSHNQCVVLATSSRICFSWVKGWLHLPIWDRAAWHHSLQRPAQPPKWCWFNLWIGLLSAKYDVPQCGMTDPHGENPEAVPWTLFKNLGGVTDKVPSDRRPQGFHFTVKELHLYKYFGGSSLHNTHWHMRRAIRSERQRPKWTGLSGVRLLTIFSPWRSER